MANLDEDFVPSAINTRAVASLQEEIAEDLKAEDKSLAEIPEIENKKPSE